MSNVSFDKPVAYFCAEYGLQANLPLYAGGLGVLSGDTFKEAADQNFPLVALGLLYRGGKTIQKLSADGMQYEEDLTVDPVALGFEHVFVPHEDQPLFIRVHLTREDVWARVWRKVVNNTTLYLLDTDTDQNEPNERGICRAIYFGSEESLLKQEMVLGIGGVKLLHALDIHPSVYHVNEGRPAFIYWQIIRHMMDQSGIAYAEAAEKARRKIVYTNHTLVRAGNPDFDTQVLENYALYYAEKMGITIEELLKPGIDPSNDAFSMTQYALNTSSKASAVSQPHLALSKSLWPEFNWVGITNGVHMPTWQDTELAQKVLNPTELWQRHITLKRETMEYVQKRCGFGYDPERLVITWARRIAGYKRLDALFENVETLARLLDQEGKPVQLLVAGKAHASDTTAKQILKRVIEMMGTKLNGHAIFVPNYDLDLARYLTRGSDVWINTPILGQEASGTSGMKAIANGVLQLTVEDGWAAEVDWHDVGFTLDSNHLTETIYFKLEQDVIPSFYDRDEAHIPRGWIAMMQRSMAQAKHYSTSRMLQEYKELLYQ